MTAVSGPDPAGDLPFTTAPPWTDAQRAAARRLLPAAGGSAELDRLAGLAARLLSVPSAMASLLTDVQTVAGGSGLPPALAVGSSAPLAQSVCLLTARDAEAVLVPDARVDPRLAGVAFVESGDIVAYLGVPLTADNGQIVGALCVFDTRPRAWSDTDAALLTELAASAVADLELGALGREFDLSRTRSDLAIESAEMGTFDLDVCTGALIWDARLIELFGYDDVDRFDGTIASVARRMHEADADRIAATVQEAVDTVGVLHVRYRIVLPSGQVRWLQSRGRVVADENGVAARVVGVSFDVTAQMDALAHSQHVLDAMAVGVIAMDADFRLTWVNVEAARIGHLAREDMIGASMWELFPGSVDSVFEEVYRRVAHTRQPESFEAFYPQPLNIWVEVRVQPDDEGVLLNIIDVTAQHEMRGLLQMSVDIGEELALAADADAAVSALARRTVPALGDWVIVSLLEPDGRVRDVLSWHADRALVSDVLDYAAHRLEGGGSGVVQKVIASSEPQLIPTGVLAIGRARLQTEAAKAALEVLGPESVGVFPLLTGDRVIGVLSLYRGAHRAAMTPQERDVAMSICRRGGMAVENRRLVAALAETAEHDRTVARALQEALLTTLPVAEGLHIEARYLPAADQEQVGGDWYDAVVKPDGTLAIAIGDVMGHDIVAAGVMGQLRGMLRTFTWDRDEPASDVLCRLDGAISGMHLRAIASVVTARIEPGVDDVGARTLRWSNAGHPPPVLMHPDGSVELLHAADPDMLLGVRPGWSRNEYVRPFPAGSAVLLYTDGLIETRGATLDDGFARLADSVATHRDLEPGALLDAVIADLVGPRPDDDVALLFVRAGQGVPVSASR